MSGADDDTKPENGPKAPGRRAATTLEQRRPVANARLIAVSGSRAGCTYQVGGVTTIGRASDCEVVIDNAECSRRHARIESHGGGYCVRDLGSRNGTILNGARIEGEQPLAFGDRLRVGPEDVFLLTHHDPVEDHLLQRQRLETLGRLTAGVAHDLNNLLGAVRASVDFLRALPSDARHGEEANGCLDDISTAASRAADLAGRLLSFAKPTGSHAPANLSEIVDEGVQLARRTFDRAIRLSAEVQPELFVEGDATQLHQVLMNLLVNARDAVDGHGAIAVSLESDGDEVLLRVRDDGCGMDAATAAHVFEPFHTTKRARTGFGLGLTTVADIVEAHEGRCEVESAPGEGALFTVTLPRASPPPHPLDVATLDHLPPGAPPSTAGIHVAIVDDEPVLRRSLARVFRRAGFALATLERGEELLALFAEPGASIPDALVLDLDLPGITGEETLRRLRRSGIEIPVVCISGHHDPSRQENVRALGAAAFLAKPFDPAALMAAVVEAIHRGCGVHDAITE